MMYGPWHCPDPHAWDDGREPDEFEDAFAEWLEDENERQDAATPSPGERT